MERRKDNTRNKMKDWIRILDASYDAHICKLDHKDCRVLADDIRALLREEETARKEIEKLKGRLELYDGGYMGHLLAEKTKEMAELKADSCYIEAARAKQTIREQEKEIEDGRKTIAELKAALQKSELEPRETPEKPKLDESGILRHNNPALDSGDINRGI